MGRIALIVLKAIIGIALAGSVLVQAVILPLMWIDLEGAPTAFRIAVIGVLLLGVICLQVIGVCIWRLLTLVTTGRVFSPAAFRFVDIVIAAIATGAVLVASLAVIGAVLNRTQPGDEFAPGLVGLILGGAIVVAGVALVVYVMRMLLVQAIAIDTDARTLRAELDEVI